MHAHAIAFCGLYLFIAVAVSPATMANGAMDRLYGRTFTPLPSGDESLHTWK